MVLNFQTQFPSHIDSSCSADKTSHIYISNSFYLAYRFPAASKLLILPQKASRDPILNKKPSPYRIHQGLTMPRGFQSRSRWLQCSHVSHRHNHPPHSKRNQSTLASLEMLLVTRYRTRVLPVELERCRKLCSACVSLRLFCYLAVAARSELLTPCLVSLSRLGCVLDPFAALQMHRVIPMSTQYYGQCGRTTRLNALHGNRVSGHPFSIILSQCSEPEIMVPGLCGQT